MNYVVIPARVQCTKCNNIQETARSSCVACGISFIFGDPNPWKSDALTTPTPSKCMWDNIPPGQLMGIVCNCPKCIIT